MHQCLWPMARPALFLTTQSRQLPWSLESTYCSTLAERLSTVMMRVYCWTMRQQRMAGRPLCHLGCYSQSEFCFN